MGASASALTWRQHWTKVAERGRPTPDLEPLPLPPDGARVWQWFTELHRQRGSNGYGPNALTYEAISAWAMLTGRHPRPWEVAVLCALDLEWRRSVAKPERTADEEPD